MPFLATARTPEALGVSVKTYYHRFHFLVAVSVPSLTSTTDVLKLYGSETSCTDALIEATGDNPGCSRYGEWEYLTRERLSELRSTLAHDPVAQTLKNLGRTDRKA